MTELETAALDAERKYNSWLASMITRHQEPEKDECGMTAEARALASFQAAMSKISCVRIKAAQE
jgi:hypothetical protein